MHNTTGKDALSPYGEKGGFGVAEDAGEANTRDCVKYTTPQSGLPTAAVTM